MNRTLFLVALAGCLAGCSSLLPGSKETSGNATTAWQSYEEAEQAFASIKLGTTTVRELAALRLDPRTNPNITVLHNFQVRERFIPNNTVTAADLDGGVRECVEARSTCIGWEINQTATQKKRNGNAALDMLKMRRETHTSGWRFSGLLLIKDGVVLYKLAGGQPHIHEIASSEDALAPLQAIGTKLNAINGIDVTDVRNGIKALAGGNSGHVEPVTAIKIR
ncbi:MAG TPA: hypothetical protein VFA72_21910 [Burkholderiales bacterium]|nr:hypothetical protein [Burkholderiales bacterium]